MTYLLLSAGFVLLALALAALLSRGRRVASLRARLIAATALVVLTAVFDNIMIAAGLFAYSPEHTSGISIGLAPIEDFAYPIAAVILLPALWSRLRRGHDDP